MNGAIYKENQIGRGVNGLPYIRLVKLKGGILFVDVRINNYSEKVRLNIGDKITIYLPSLKKGSSYDESKPLGIGVKKEVYIKAFCEHFIIFRTLAGYYLCITYTGLRHVLQRPEYLVEEGI